jgi:hypothetical protein
MAPALTKDDRTQLPYSISSQNTETCRQAALAVGYLLLRFAACQAEGLDWTKTCSAPLVRAYTAKVLGLIQIVLGRL